MYDIDTRWYSDEELFIAAKEKLWDMQFTIAMEELSELVSELARYRRKLGRIEKLAEKFEDVVIMLEQLDYMFNSDKFYQIREYTRKFKMKRFEMRLINMNVIDGPDLNDWTTIYFRNPSY